MAERLALVTSTTGMTGMGIEAELADGEPPLTGAGGFATTAGDGWQKTFFA